MPKVFTAKQKITIVQYGDTAIQDFSFTNIANDFFAGLKKMIAK